MNPRAFISFFMLVLVVPFTGSSQCPSNKGQIEIAASYGFITGDEVVENAAPAENSQYAKNIAYNSGAPFITVRYFIYNRLAIGFSGGSTNEKWHYTDPLDPSLSKSNYKQTSTTVAFELYYIYVFRKYFEAYTFAGFGPSFITEASPVYTNGGFVPVITKQDPLKVQYTPVGVRVGGRLGAFAELGIGYKGIFNFGVSLRLGPSCWWKE